MNNISMNQALRVWSELWKAYYGNNGFGGDTAEIYAYMFMPHSPAFGQEGGAGGFIKESNEKTALTRRLL